MAHPVARNFFLLTTAAVVAIALFVAYCSFSERLAERKARAFCEALQVGMSVESLKAQALADGASGKQTQWLERLSGESPVLTVVFTGAFPVSRHVCNVYGAPAVVRSEYIYLD